MCSLPIGGHGLPVGGAGATGAWVTPLAIV